MAQLPSSVVLGSSRSAFSSLRRWLLAVFRNVVWVCTPFDPGRWRWFKRAWRGRAETAGEKSERWLREEIALAAKREREKAEAA